MELHNNMLPGYFSEFMYRQVLENILLELFEFI